MAGIGFELRKVFEKKGAIAFLRAYGYAGIVCSGPMVLSIALLTGLRHLFNGSGADLQTQNLVMSMITYCLFASMLPVSLLAMTVTRYSADMLYERKPERVLPSLYGSLVITLIGGDALFGLCLALSGIPLLHCVFCLLFFNELTVLWSQMNYLMAIRDYKSILILFAVGVAVALGAGWLSIGVLRWDAATSVMGSILLGYGIMMAGLFLLLHRYFPRMEGGMFQFLAWIDRYPSLPVTGLLLAAGLFGHIALEWFGPGGVHIGSLFYAAPQYDMPAIAALFSILVTTINFTASVEVHFYPRFCKYMGLFNGRGTLDEIELTEREMLHDLRKELNYLAFRQIVATMLFILVGGPILKGAGFEFSESMLGTYRSLCIGYGLYAIANSMMLIQLCLTDYKGAFWTAFAFLTASLAGTAVFQRMGAEYDGFGFLLGSMAMYFTAVLRLNRYLGKLQHHMLSAKPVIAHERGGFFSRLSNTQTKRKNKGVLTSAPISIGRGYLAKHARSATSKEMEAEL